MLFNKLSLVTIAAYAVQSTTAASIFGIANTTEGFETLAAAVSAAGLADTLSGDGTFTVFAPANSAFDALPSGLVEQLLKPEWLPHLTDVLLYHTLGSKVMSGDLSDGDVTAINGGTLTINTDPPSVNDIAIIAPIDAEADNGVVHGIESVLTPSWISTDIVDIGAGDDMFSTLVAAVQAAGLVDALKGPGPLTLFAPTNDAFAALPEGTLDDLLLPENKEKLGDILKYHVVAGNVPSTSLENGMVPTLLGEKVKVDLTDGAKINGAKVISPDVLANNGMIHVIDAVLIPPNAAPTKAPTKMPTAEESGAIAHGATVAAVAAVVAGVFSIA